MLLANIAETKDFGLLVTFIGIGIVVNIIGIFIAIQVRGERLQNQEYIASRRASNGHRPD